MSTESTPKKRRHGDCDAAHPPPPPATKIERVCQVIVMPDEPDARNGAWKAAMEIKESNFRLLTPTQFETMMMVSSQAVSLKDQNPTILISAKVVIGYGVEPLSAEQLKYLDLYHPVDDLKSDVTSPELDWVQFGVYNW